MDSEELHTILSELCRELAVAKTVESDLDLAFQLQMQEVMNASASALIQPSPSSSLSSSTPPPFLLRDDDVFGHAFGANMDSEELHTILSEQRRELAAPKAVESDLDLPFRFQLQLQELMNASASAIIQQSPSFSSSTSPPFQLRDDDVFGPYEFDASMDSEELHTILSEQRRELAAAKAVESDLDLAFQLQMQEAMNASALIQQSPSSSFSSSTPPPFQLRDDDVSGPSFATVLDEEIARFERERADREQAEAEMRRMRDDLSRWIHDQAFALEMSRIAEEEWQNTGDHFNRPYGEGSSSSAAISNPEFFQLYFKGLVREETVKGDKKTLAGIGIAVCDTRQHRIFELRKALLGGGENREMCTQVAEIKALIEGLNSAVTLGIKRITFFCGDNALYEYVTGQTIPRQGNVATLVGQVTLLQRQFSYCSPSLVNVMQNDIKFALELANEAIVSQVTCAEESSHGKYLKETCSICLEDANISQMFSVNGCLHRYCPSCMKKHVEVKLLQGLLPECPHEGCKTELQLDSCKIFLTSELCDIMRQRIKESSIPVTDKIYCPYPRCSALMSKREVLANTRLGGSSICKRCNSCNGLFCMNCKVPWHSDMSCDAYKNLNPYMCAEDAKLKSLATSNLWRQCMKCNHMVELAEGCNHIYCRAQPSSEEEFHGKHYAYCI